VAQTISRRSWKHKSVLALIRGGKQSDPVAIIRQKARNLVSRARSQGWSGPPFDPLILASLLGIKCRPSRDLFSAEAQLSPQPGRQLLLEFHPDRPDGRKNYSVFHEIVHTFFDDCYEIVHQRKTDREQFDPNEEVESLCQIGASELLMPEDEFLRDLDDHAFSLESVPALVARYSASREAVLRRMVHLSQGPCAAVFFSKRLSPREKEAAQRVSRTNGAILEPKMRIVYSVPSDDFPLFLPPHKSVPDNSCVNSAIIVDDVTQARECWGIPGFGDWRVEAMRLPPVDDADDIIPTVAALVSSN
jgi:hypothetical protein